MKIPHSIPSIYIVQFNEDLLPFAITFKFKSLFYDNFLIYYCFATNVTVINLKIQNLNITNLYSEEILNEALVNLAERGININDECINNVRYVDDTILITDNE